MIFTTNVFYYKYSVGISVLHNEFTDLFKVTIIYFILSFSPHPCFTLHIFYNFPFWFCLSGSFFLPSWMYHMPLSDVSCTPRAHKSMYHGLGYGTFMYLQAIMTFEPVSISHPLMSVCVAIKQCFCTLWKRRIKFIFS